MRKTLAKGLALAVVGTAMMAGSAMATPMLKIVSGADSFLLIDDMAAGSSITHNAVTYTSNKSDTIALDGAVNFSGAVGNFILSVNTGLTKDILGTASVPKMHLDTVATTIGTPGTGLMTVSFTETGFGPLATGLQGWITNFGPTGAIAAQSLKVYTDSTDTPFGTETLIADLGPATNAALVDIFNGIPTSNPFSITMVATVKHNAAGGSSFNADLNPTPEPATMLLLGSGLAGLAGIGRRRMKKA